MRNKLRFLVAALLALMSGQVLAQRSDITIRVALQGGEFQRVQAKYAGDRFTAATGIKIEWIAGNLTDHLQKMVASRGRTAPFDVVYLDDKLQGEAIATNTVMKLDPKIVTNLTHLYDQAKQKDGYGPAMLFWAWGLFYNKDAFQKAGIPEPTSWEDLWNPKLAGKVAIFDIGGPGGIDFVVKANELAGGKLDNLEPGLKKISELKVHSYIASSNTLSATMVAGDVWVAPFNNGRSNGMIDSGFPGRFIIPREGGYSHTTTIDVVAGSKYPNEAQQYINYVLDPVSQLGQAFEIPYAPTNKTLANVLAAYPNISKTFPVPNGEMMKHLSTPDWRTVFDNYPTTVDKWNRMVRSR